MWTRLCIWRALVWAMSTEQHRKSAHLDTFIALEQNPGVMELIALCNPVKAASPVSIHTAFERFHAHLRKILNRWKPNLPSYPRRQGRKLQSEKRIHAVDLLLLSTLLSQFSHDNSHWSRAPSLPSFDCNLSIGDGAAISEMGEVLTTSPSRCANQPASTHSLRVHSPNGLHTASGCESAFSAK